MKSSAWSSRVISACSAVGVALLLAAPAGARLSIVPSSVVEGQAVDLEFSVPNDTDKNSVDHVTLGIPQAFALDDAEAKPGWSQSRTGQAVTWSGGLVAKGTYARFGIRGTAPTDVETVLFNVVVGDRTGKSVTYHVPLAVTAPAASDNDGRSLARTALIVALVAAALALVAGFIAVIFR
jgi:uncharacterized protein YcnI